MAKNREQKAYITSRHDGVLGWAKRWAQSQSLWKLPFGVSCCTTEYANAHGLQYLDSSSENEFISTASHLSDLLIITGPINRKLLPELIETYNEMRAPKWVIAMGSCAINGGPFVDSYNIVSNLKDYLPIDIEISGCPPRPSELINGINKLKLQIKEGALSSD